MISLKELLEDTDLFERNRLFKENIVSWDFVISQLNEMLFDFTLHEKLDLYIHRCCLVTSAPIDKLTEIKVKLGNPQVMLEHFYTFPTTPFDMVLEVVSKGNDAKCIYDLAHLIENDITNSLDKLEVTGRLPRLYYGYGYDAPNGIYVTMWLLRLTPKEDITLNNMLLESLSEGYISNKETFVKFANRKLRDILRQLGNAMSKTGNAEYIEYYAADFPGYSQDLTVSLARIINRNEEID